jgi:hypothetical protein
MSNLIEIPARLDAHRQDGLVNPRKSKPRDKVREWAIGILMGVVLGCALAWVVR